MIKESSLKVGERVKDYEARLTRLWEKNLGISIEDNTDYFQLGGDSLLSTELLLWIQEGFGIELSLLDLFESRTIATQAELILNRLRTEKPSIEKPTTGYRFFGPENEQLFGVIHNPGVNQVPAGVVLCYPMGQEYMRIHRTFVELSKKLVAVGLYVLRFDYFGCGDSAGETISGNLAQWADDIQKAVRELRNRVFVKDLYLVGARIGANLVLEVTTECDDVDGIVLWEPIVNGMEYLETLKSAHHRLLEFNAELDGYEQRDLPDCIMEVLGFPVSKKLYDELVNIDLLATPAVMNKHDTLVLANSNKPKLEKYARSQENGQFKLDYVSTGESDAIWLKEDRQNKGLIPVRAVQEIVSWISGRVL